jgi:hypothetical protein
MYSDRSGKVVSWHGTLNLGRSGYVYTPLRSLWHPGGTNVTRLDYFRRSPSLPNAQLSGRLTRARRCSPTNLYYGGRPAENPPTGMVGLVVIKSACRFVKHEQATSVDTRRATHRLPLRLSRCFAMQPSTDHTDEFFRDRPYLAAAVGGIYGSPAPVFLTWGHERESALERLRDVSGSALKAKRSGTSWRRGASRASAMWKSWRSGRSARGRWCSRCVEDFPGRNPPFHRGPAPGIQPEWDCGSVKPTNYPPGRLDGFAR